MLEGEIMKAILVYLISMVVAVYITSYICNAYFVPEVIAATEARSYNVAENMLRR